MQGVGQIAQLVEQRTENPRVGGSTPSLATIIFNNLGLPIRQPFRFCATTYNQMTNAEPQIRGLYYQNTASQITLFS